MTNAEKTFDAVEMMRKLRHDLGKRTSGMSFEEEKRYLKQHAIVLRDTVDKDSTTQDMATTQAKDPASKKDAVSSDEKAV